MRRSHVAITYAVLVGGTLAALSGCSLLVSLSGLSGGPTTADDATTSHEASVDASEGFADAGDAAGPTTDAGADADAGKHSGLDASGCVGGDSRTFDPATGHCYERYTEALSWLDAKARCEQLGAHLATIESENEQLIAKNLASQPEVDTWLGASDLAVEGTYAWVTGEPFSFAAWEPGEPNGATDENCLHIFWLYSGKWNDSDCTVQLHFICERE